MKGVGDEDGVVDVYGEDGVDEDDPWDADDFEFPCLEVLNLAESALGWRKSAPCSALAAKKF